ncbi:hypothetical protein L1987_76077 [Smallanthus sonchifolius]|uniref:Uncharacterized protein n=1 Tax=Smallanthus sonchifolius TaxID=185202 RepID=A0ACB9A7R3_9ASTR|nr:hypothetical protein L1987_76077 [Smallanthus sonchifolius]
MLASDPAVAGSDSRKQAMVDIDDQKSNPVYGSMSMVGRAREMEAKISVSALCKDNMPCYHGGGVDAREPTPERLTGGEVEELWKTAINRSFERMDAMALTLCQCDGLEEFKVCRYHPRLSVVGSTAVVGLLKEKYIIVGLCGDSRAVLCRNDKAVPLSVEHKEPEFVFVKRESEDTSLILGSDGLWGVVSSEMCCEMVHECHQEDVNRNLGVVRGGGPLYMVAAAALLVRLAIGRRSMDNISVIVVDLRG